MTGSRFYQWCVLMAAAAALAGSPALAASGRVSVSLDGSWEVGESVGAEMPAAFGHRAPVPGLTNLAQPAFADVDRFDSHESLRHPWVKSSRATPEALAAPVGVPRQTRNYFWYRTTFRAPEKKQVAILKINKAQFGTAVWLNGKKIGEHLGCFSAGYFDLTQAIDWSGSNRLVVRIGAHPAALPVTAPGRHRSRKAQVDAGDLRQRLRAALRQPGDPHGAGRPAHPVLGDRGPDGHQELRRESRHLRVDAAGAHVEGTARRRRDPYAHRPSAGRRGEDLDPDLADPQCHALVARESLPLSTGDHYRRR